MATERKHLQHVNVKSRGRHIIFEGVESMVVKCEGGKSWLFAIGRKIMERTDDQKFRNYLKQRIW